MTKIWIMRTKWIGFINCFLKFNKVCLYVDSPFHLFGIRRASAYWCFSSFLKVSQPLLLQNYFSSNLSPSVFPLFLRIHIDIRILSFITIFCLFTLLSFVCFVVDYFFKIILNLLWTLFFFYCIFSDLKFLFGSFTKLLCQFLYLPVPCQVFTILF